MVTCFPCHVLGNVLFTTFANDSFVGKSFSRYVVLLASDIPLLTVYRIPTYLLRSCYIDNKSYASLTCVLFAVTKQLITVSGACGVMVVTIFNVIGFLCD